MAPLFERETIQTKSPKTLHKLVLLPGIIHRSLALFISVLLLSESVAATPIRFSPLLKAGLIRFPDSRPEFKLRANSESPLKWTKKRPISCSRFQPTLAMSQGFEPLAGLESMNQPCLLKEGWGGAPSLAQQPAATQQDATRAAAERAFQEGMQLYQQGTAESLRQAIAKWEEALPLYGAVGDKEGEAFSLGYIGFIYSNLGEKLKALDYYNQSRLLFRVLGDKAREAVTLNNIGSIYNDLGEKLKALDYYNQSLPLARASGDKAGEAATLNNIGGVYDDLGEKLKALDYYNQSLSLRRAVGDKAGEATTLNNIGRVYDDLGEKLKALEYYNQSLPLARVVGDKVQ